MVGQEALNTTKKRIKVKLARTDVPYDLDALLIWYTAGIVKHDPTKEVLWQLGDGSTHKVTRHGTVERVYKTYETRTL